MGSEKHIDSLDGFRGIAILLVFFFHYLPRNPHNPFSWMASRYSYGLYVWHGLPSPVCITWQSWFTRQIHPWVVGQVVYAVAMLALFTAVAVASYHLLELRFLKLKSRFQYAGPGEEPPSLAKFQIADNRFVTMKYL